MSIFLHTDQNSLFLGSHNRGSPAELSRTLFSRTVGSELSHTLLNIGIPDEDCLYAIVVPSGLGGSVADTVTSSGFFSRHSVRSVAGSENENDASTYKVRRSSHMN